MTHFKIGDVEITRIEELLGPAAPAKDFFREFQEEDFLKHLDWLAPDFYDPPSGKLVASVHSWLVRTDKHVILIDTCCGNHKVRPGMPRYDQLNTDYLDRLKRAGVSPEEVDYVMCTHLHVDHAGWNTQLLDGRWVPTFPNAKYVFSRREHDFWCDAAAKAETPEGIRNVYNDSVLPIVEAGKAVFFEDTFELDGCLTMRPAPGHTSAHVRIDLDSGGRKGVFCGDVLHNPVQVPLRHWNTIFCSDPDQAVASRLEVLSHCSETGALLMPVHFGKPHIAKIDEKKGRFSARFDVL